MSEIGVDDDVEIALDRGKDIYGTLGTKKNIPIPFAVLNVVKHSDNHERCFECPILAVGEFEGNMIGKLIQIPIYGNDLNNFLDLLEFVIKKMPMIFEKKWGEKTLVNLKEEIIREKLLSQDVRDCMKYSDCPRYIYTVRNKLGYFGIEFNLEVCNFPIVNYAVLALYLTIHDLNQIDWIDVESLEEDDPIKDDMVVCYFVITKTFPLFHEMKRFDLRLKKENEIDRCQ